MRKKLMMLFCGAGSFKDVDKEEEEEDGAGAGMRPAAATKAKAKGKKSTCGGKTTNKGTKDNPYASRGLDKFSTVVSELGSRRDSILRGVVGPDVDADRLMVRFVQSDEADKGWVPIIVKLPSSEEEQASAAAETKTKQRQSKPAKSTSTSRSATPTEPGSPTEDAATNHVAAPAVNKAAVPAPAGKKNKKKKAGGGERWSWSWGKMVRPCRYWPLALALLLLSLVVFGRVFAICCTSIWWYLLPILSGDNEARGPTRLPSAKTLVSGKKSSSGGAALEVISPRSHAHRKG